MIKRKAVVNVQECEACGCCIKVGPRNAITVPNGIHASIDGVVKEVSEKYVIIETQEGRAGK